ncbi:MAG: hypothetical protein KBA06_04535, partial [Saprospiraceae bacterium]|nr:hypothetical protein [Saprospiraceae bacterium]
LINNQNKLSEKITPIIEQRLDFLKNNFPKEYDAAVTKIFESKIKESQADLLNVIYPVMGKMIMKFITLQFQQTKDSIDNQIRSMFSLKGMQKKFRNLIFGVSESDDILSLIDKPSIQEVYLIQRDSGILMGSASLQNTIDQDVIAGMLTAIKSFVEDAFQRENEDLEMIQYGTYKIFIQNFHKYYFSVAMTGSISSVESANLSKKIMDFAETELSRNNRTELNEENFYYLSDKLKLVFLDGVENN